MTVQAVPYFSPGSKGGVFMMKYHRNSITPSEAFLIIPPFAEEMNKSRRMLSKMSTELAVLGYEVIFPDLFGTGDSEGEFSKANWRVWCDDLKMIYGDLVSRGLLVNILALRAGALLAHELLSCEGMNFNNVVLWQPVVSGDIWLTQFLRLKLASRLFDTTDNKETTKTLKAKLDNGQFIEVAGYLVSPSLVSGMRQVRLHDLRSECCKNVLWFEVVSNEDKPILTVSKSVAENWRQNVMVYTEAVVGQSFWATTEIVDVDALVFRTISALNLVHE